MKNSPDAAFRLLIILFILFVVTLLLVWIARLIKDFSQELHYLDMEIDRTEGEEQQYWLGERRRLWLSLIPFVRY